MIILDQNDTDSRHVICLFGVGLLGASILANLHRCGNYTECPYSFSWENAQLQKQEAAAIQSRLCSIVENDISGNRTSIRVTFIWSAGRGGFNGSMESLAEEMLSFKVVVALADSISQQFSAVPIDFHLLSSAGGLYEGQTYITGDSQPAPKRPYGVIKLQQEQLLQAMTTNISKFIYRPSSVYGCLDRRQRMGLIPMLLINSYNNQSTTIYGNLSTLRDYVYQGDIGVFIAEKICQHDGRGDCEVFHLCSGRPSSIYEIKHIVEKITGKNLYYSFKEIATNSNDITFSDNILPPSWVTVDIESGIRKIYNRLTYKLSL